MATKAHQRKKLERLCRYVTRPPISEQRLSLTKRGQVRVKLKTPWRNGTTHIVLEPLEFIARLAALVPRPRSHLVRYHGVFAPNHRYRHQVVKAHQGKSNTKHTKTPSPARHTPSAMSWAQRLKRVFNIDVSVCAHCAGKVKVIGCVEDLNTIELILAHRANRPALFSDHSPRAPPQLDLFQS